jgi:hypothetical protein
MAARAGSISLQIGKTRIRELEAARMAREQVHAEPILERLDVLADGALGHVHPVRRPRQVQRTCGGTKILSVSRECVAVFTLDGTPSSRPGTAAPSRLSHSTAAVLATPLVAQF